MRRILPSLVVLLSTSLLTSAKTIDFDASYGALSGSALTNQITNTINEASEGDTLVFKSTSYDFEDHKITISKGITLSGIVPSQTFSPNPGAYDVKTKFINVMNLFFSANNIQFINLEVVAHDSDNYVFNRIQQASNNDVANFKFYTGLVFHNVIFRDGQVQIYTAEGSGAEVSNVSFLNFSKSGWHKNRREKIDYCPQVIFKRCRFVANEEKAYYDTRGIATDAGNDEYPVVWDHSNMIVDSCTFDRAGVGFSKGKNATITNNHFIGYSKYIDMIHMEEYTNKIWIENNTFEYAAPSRTFFIDREGQPCEDITIINNTFIGQYYWIFWCNSPLNLRFEGNDLTQASASNSDDITFDFTNLHDEAQHLNAAMPIEGLTFRNNVGIDRTTMGKMSVRTLRDDNSNTIEGILSSKLSNTQVAERPTSLLDTNYRYQIRNKATQEVFAAQSSSTKIGLTSTAPSDQSDLWEVQFRYPYSYEFKNVKTGLYLEVDYGYTLGDYSKDPSSLNTYYLEQKSDYKNKDKVPHFFIRRYWVMREEFFEIAPGGNEQKSKVIKEGDHTLLTFAQNKETGDYYTPDDKSSWELIPAEKNPNSIEGPSHASIQTYPNPAQDHLRISIGRMTSPINIAIISLNGETVRENLHADNENLSINTKGLLPGSYIIQLRNKYTSLSRHFIKL